MQPGLVMIKNKCNKIGQQNLGARSFVADE